MVTGYTQAEQDILFAGKVSANSPALAGTPTAPTPGAGNSSTQIATTEFVGVAVNNKLVSPAFTGTPTAPTAAPGTSSSVLATTAFVAGALANTAPTASPTFTGTVSGITAAMVGLGNVSNTSDVTKFTTYGLYPILRYNGTAWPARTLPVGYSGPVKWDSGIYPSASAPTAAIDGDLWERQRAS